MLDLRLFIMLHLLEMYLLKKLMQLGNLSDLKTILMRYIQVCMASLAKYDCL